MSSGFSTDLISRWHADLGVARRTTVHVSAWPSEHESWASDYPVGTRIDEASIRQGGDHTGCGRNYWGHSI